MGLHPLAYTTLKLQISMLKYRLAFGEIGHTEYVGLAFGAISEYRKADPVYSSRRESTILEFAKFAEHRMANHPSLS